VGEPAVPEAPPVVAPPVVAPPVVAPPVVAPPALVPPPLDAVPPLAPAPPLGPDSVPPTPCSSSPRGPLQALRTRTPTNQATARRTPETLHYAAQVRIDALARASLCVFVSRRTTPSRKPPAET